MKNSIYLICILWVAAWQQTSAQSQIDYPHCGCVEKVNVATDDKEKWDGTYELICKGKQIVSGQYKQGIKTGKWITKTPKGTVIKASEFSDGKLHGKYELFYYDGTPKLTANFVNGQEDGLWQYFNDKGKVIKTGSYQSGKPIGVWSISDKAGRKIVATYNLDTEEFKNTIVPPYYKSGGIDRDDQSGEWYIKYPMEGHSKTSVSPLGGYDLSRDLFLKYLPIPSTLMDTYTNFKFIITLELERNTIKSIKATMPENSNFNSVGLIYPFIVSTNRPGKLHRVEHTARSIQLLQDDIVEAIRVMGPWIGNSTTEIQIPFVLNEM